MKIICITGKSGSGKTTFSSLLSQKLDCKHIDLDKVCHQALFQPDIKRALCNEFGNEILSKDNNLDRMKIGDIVFSDEAKMKILTDLSWKFMEDIVDELLLQDDEFIILDAVLLPHTKYWTMCNLKILIQADDSLRKIKVIERDKISESYFNKRDYSSIDYSSYHFNYTFDNNYDINIMNTIIDELLEKEFNN